MIGGWSMSKYVRFGDQGLRGYMCKRLTFSSTWLSLNPLIYKVLRVRLSNCCIFYIKHFNYGRIRIYCTYVYIYRRNANIYNKP